MSVRADRSRKDLERELCEILDFPLFPTFFHFREQKWPGQPFFRTFFNDNKGLERFPSLRA
jgi:hypothetical protein